MRSSHTITLFHDIPDPKREPSTYLFSILFHAVAIFVIAYAVKHGPRIQDHSVSDRYTVRLMNLRFEEEPPPKPKSGGGSISYPGPQAATEADESGGSPAAAESQELAPKIPAQQTLVQPDIPPNTLLTRPTPIPAVLLWSPQDLPKVRVVPPPPQEITTTEMRPALIRPNHESEISTVAISSTPFLTKAPALPPSTTSPVVVHGPQQSTVPQTVARPAGPPTPARVMSLSDFQIKEGTIALPAVNQTARSVTSGGLGAGQTQGTLQSGSGTSPTSQNASGSGQGSGEKHGTGQNGTQTASSGGGDAHSGTPGAGTGTGGGTGASTGNGTGQNLGPGSGSDSRSGPATARIRLPKDGSFGMVVVGPSLSEKYPETVGIWNGRLAYTVYLHVGLPKNWILQYAMPRNVEVASAGVVTRPEAPWPYDIVRPNLKEEDFNSDAIMIHGFVNVQGHFEQLSVVFPPECPQSKFLLTSLEQWNFRPATQNGQVAMVEVLLIIPDPEQ
jgi:hypothetical protein